MSELVGSPGVMTAPGLRFWLRADAVVTGLNGLGYLAAASVLAEWTGVPAATQRGLGVFLVLFAIAVALVSARPRLSLVLGVVAVNAIWVVASLVVAISGGLETTGLGRMWAVAQAVVVAVFAVLQYRARPGT